MNNFFKLCHFCCNRNGFLLAAHSLFHFFYFGLLLFELISQELGPNTKAVSLLKNWYEFEIEELLTVITCKTYMFIGFLYIQK